MKLGFEEAQSPYSSGSQSARAWTEGWVARTLYCPNCGHAQVNQFLANKPVADFYCPSCAEQYELKSQKRAFGTKVLDGAYRTMMERLQSTSNPHLMLLNYDLQQLSVTNVFVVPKHFFVPSVIEKRRPLAETARRAGWTGCNILLAEIPASGKIHIVRNGQVRSKDLVIADWEKTRFLQDEDVAARGWLIDVMNCVETLGRTEFALEDVYRFEQHLGLLYPDNRNVRPKIRQQLQRLRDRGYLDFTQRGRYRLRR